MSAAAPHRGSNLDVLRLAAASAVILSHSMLVVVGGAWWAANPRNPFNQMGDDALAVFFVVSGILVTRSWCRDPHLGRYLSRRMLRLMPALLVAVAITTFMVGPITSALSPAAYFRAPGTWAYLLNGTLFFEPYQLPGVFAHLPEADAVNGSLWTLRYEFLCYLMVPLLVAAAAVLRHRAAVLVLGAATAALATWAITRHSDFVILGMDPWTISGGPGAAGWNAAPLFILTSYFMAGMCIQMWLSRIRFDSRAAALCVPLFIVSSQTPLLFALSAVTLAYPIAYFGLVARPMGRQLVAHGDASYGIYVWGFVVEQVVVLTLGPRLSAIGVFAIAMPISWVIGLLSWRLIERPALRFKPHARVSEARAPRRLAAEAA
jgi:peptidoglycan/LPS O-acetylase OafA/YrhL